MDPTPELVEQIRRRRAALDSMDVRLLRLSVREFRAKTDEVRWRDFFDLCSFATGLAAVAPEPGRRRRIEDQIEEEGNQRLRLWIRAYVRASD